MRARGAPNEGDLPDRRQDAEEPKKVEANHA